MSTRDRVKLKGPLLSERPFCSRQCRCYFLGLALSSKVHSELCMYFYCRRGRTDMGHSCWWWWTLLLKRQCAWVTQKYQRKRQNKPNHKVISYSPLSSSHIVRQLPNKWSLSLVVTHTNRNVSKRLHNNYKSAKSIFLIMTFRIGMESKRDKEKRWKVNHFSVLKAFRTILFWYNFWVWLS